MKVYSDNYDIVQEQIQRYMCEKAAQEEPTEEAFEERCREV